MNEHEITMAQAEIRALTEAKRAMSIRIANLEDDKVALEADNAALRAILAQHGLTTADEATEPEDAHGG